MKVGTRVYDRWWPAERRGTVVKKAPTSVTVRWLDGTEWRYDKAHRVEFLRSEPVRRRDALR